MTTITESLVQQHERIQPLQTNSHGNAHGGELVKMMDELAAISAVRVADVECVTARISEVNFHTPITEGDFCRLTAFVYNTGETSLDVYVKVEKEDKSSKERKEATTAQFTMVSIDEHGTPVPCGDVSRETEKDKQLYNEATED